MSDDLKRHNDSHTFYVADGVGKGLGRIKNQKRSWRKMKRLLSQPSVDSSVTFAQFQSLDDDTKLAKKRAPGSWTPSRYKGNRRKIAALEAKTLIVYDLDYITIEQLADIREGRAPISRWEWFMHTTRSHCPERPRVRLILPISRELPPDEAQAVFRFLAQYLSDDPEEAIEIPDLVSFRGNQTMFWPSISRDQEFWTDENVAPILDVDEFLSEHPGWDDFENLPFQSRERKRGVPDPNRRMEDPYEKPEPIGAFCRCYTVQEVIENWLSDVYAPGDSETEERYTYIPGSSSNGAVVYEDGKFLCSHHGTDPVDTVNAFDLLRIHKFGHLDSEAKEDTPPGSLPSFKAAVKFARQDERVLEELYGGHDATLDDFEDDDEDEDGEIEDADDDLLDLLGEEPDEDGDDDDDDLGARLDDLDDEDEPGRDREKRKKKKDKTSHAWMRHLKRRADGSLENSLNNTTLIVSNDRRIKDCIGYNEFTFDPVCLAPIRSPKIDCPSPAVPKRDRRLGRRWEDRDDIAIMQILASNEERGGYNCDMDRNKVEMAVLTRGMMNPVHPVKTFLGDLHSKWVEKGSPRGALESLIPDYLGCPDTPFHREVGVLLTVAAVARIYEPGCKFDVMPIIEGPTGSRKSTFWQVLFGGFVTELKCDLDDSGRVIENLRGNWAVEMAEMAAAKKADTNTLKMQLSSARDTHRLAYAKREQEFPRQSIWVGTSNEDDYLTDPTSNRRYWVLRSPKHRFDPIDTDRLQRNLWRIWGEAVQRYREWREEQPYGDLWLDLKDAEVVREAEAIAEGSRRLTATEMIAEALQDWLDEPRTPAEADALSSGLRGDLDDMDEDDDGPRLIRNMVSPKEAYEALHREPFMQPYRNADVRTYGKALKLLPGWHSIGRVRRHGYQAEWYVRSEDGPMWVPHVAETQHEEDEIDPLLQ